MKKLITLFTAIVAILSLAGCNNNETPSASIPDTSVSATKPAEDTSTAQVPDDTDKDTNDLLGSAPVAPATDFFLSDDENGNLIIMGYEGDDTVLVIPDERDGQKITRNQGYIFANNSKVTAIKFPEHLIEIEEGTCGLNESLQVVVLGSGTKVIQTGAFMGCSSLHDVTLNDGLETLGKYAFGQCDNLKSITIPSSVKNIDSLAFYGHAKGFVIYGEAGSAAETFAKAEGIEFKAK